MPTYWIAAIVVFFVYLLPTYYLLRLDTVGRNDPDQVVVAVIFAVFSALLLGFLWPLALVGTVLFFVVRWLEEVRVK